MSTLTNSLIIITIQFIFLVTARQPNGAESSVNQLRAAMLDTETECLSTAVYAGRLKKDIETYSWCLDGRRDDGISNSVSVSVFFAGEVERQTVVDD